VTGQNEERSTLRDAAAVDPVQAVEDAIGAALSAFPWKTTAGLSKAAAAAQAFLAACEAEQLEPGGRRAADRKPHGHPRPPLPTPHGGHMNTPNTTTKPVIDTGIAGPAAGQRPVSVEPASETLGGRFERLMALDAIVKKEQI
jgi:hypothetical protein